MSDLHPDHRLTHTVKFRLSEPEHARLTKHAEARRLRVSELARQLVTGRSRRSVELSALDPAILIQLQAIGFCLRQIMSGGGCAPDLCANIADLCQRIEVLTDHAIFMEHV